MKSGSPRPSSTYFNSNGSSGALPRTPIRSAPSTSRPSQPSASLLESVLASEPDRAYVIPFVQTWSRRLVGTSRSALSPVAERLAWSLVRLILEGRCQKVAHNCLYDVSVALARRRHPHPQPHPRHHASPTRPPARDAQEPELPRLDPDAGDGLETPEPQQSLRTSTSEMTKEPLQCPTTSRPTPEPQ